MLHTLNWPSLYDRRKKTRLTTFYKFHKKKINMNSKFLPVPYTEHRATRKTHNKYYNPPHTKTDYRRLSFFPRTISDWNSLPAEVAEAPCLDSFESMLAAHR